LRQELWVYYLDGNPVESFAGHLEQMATALEDDIAVRKNLWKLLKDPPKEEFQVFLDDFTDFERSIIIVLMLGLTVEKISLYKGISQVRIRQAIIAIRYNKAWEVHYGIKEEPDRRREIRS
jgi:hypothetical protein